MTSKAGQARVREKLDRELGENICGYLNDSSVLEIAVNPCGTLFVERLGEAMTAVGKFPQVRTEQVIGTLASIHQLAVNALNPTISCELLDGSRFQAWTIPVVQAPAFSIRKRASLILTLENYVESEVLTAAGAAALRTAIEQRKNILVSGGTGTGKTTFVNAILHAMSELAPAHRLFILEDTREVQYSGKNCVFLKTTAETGMIDLIKTTLRGRPDRIIIGEVRGGNEALSMLKAWNTGHPGGVATVHADNAYLGLLRLQQLVLEVSVTEQAELIASSIDVVVSIKKSKNLAGRVVEEILQVTGYDNAAKGFQTIRII